MAVRLEEGHTVLTAKIAVAVAAGRPVGGPPPAEPPGLQLSEVYERLQGPSKHVEQSLGRLGDLEKTTGSIGRTVEQAGSEMSELRASLNDV